MEHIRSDRLLILYLIVIFNNRSHLGGIPEDIKQNWFRMRDKMLYAGELPSSFSHLENIWARLKISYHLFTLYFLGIHHWNTKRINWVFVPPLFKPTLLRSTAISRKDEKQEDRWLNQNGNSGNTVTLVVPGLNFCKVSFSPLMIFVHKIYWTGSLDWSYDVSLI